MRRFAFVAVVELTGLIGLPMVRALSQERPPGAAAAAQQEVPPLPPAPPVPVPGGGVPAGSELLSVILGRRAALLEPAELAGVAPGTKPAVLTLEQAYLLTLIRARNAANPSAAVPANFLDPTALDEEARLAGARDFDRFRQDFLADRFRDPAPAYFAALKHRQAIDSARDRFNLTKNVRQLFDELIRGEASGVSQLHLDLLDHHLLLSQQDLEVAMCSYRSAVDELKVLLGRPPGAAVVLDEHILEPFRKAFRTIDAWQHNQRRQLGTLGKLRNRLPQLNEVTIGGRSVAQVADGKIAEAEFLRACTEAADKKRGIRKDGPAARDDRDALDLRIRNLARGLVLTHRNYEFQRRGLELAVREVDQRFEQMVGLPAGGPAALGQAPNVSLQTTGVLEAQRRLYRGQAELVERWLQFKEQSLELYRELGTLPYDHWETFQRSFVPASGEQASQSSFKLLER